MAAQIFPGAFGASIADLGSHKSFRASRCYMRNLNYIYRVKRLHCLRWAVQQLFQIIGASRGYAGNLDFLARLRRHAYSSFWAINKENLRASRGYVDNLRLKCRLFQMFPILGPDHHPPSPRTVTCTGSVKRQTPIGAHVALAAVWPLLACLRVELICLPAATRWGCEPN